MGFFPSTVPNDLLGSSAIPSAIRDESPSSPPKKKHSSQLAIAEKLPEFFYMGVSKNRGTPKWMVYNGKPY